MNINQYTPQELKFEVVVEPSPSNKRNDEGVRLTKYDVFIAATSPKGEQWAWFQTAIDWVEMFVPELNDHALVLSQDVDDAVNKALEVIQAIQKMELLAGTWVEID